MSVAEVSRAEESIRRDPEMYVLPGDLLLFFKDGNVGGRSRERLLNECLAYRLVRKLWLTPICVNKLKASNKYASFFESAVSPAFV